MSRVAPSIVRDDLTPSEALALLREEHPELRAARGAWIEEGWDNRVLDVTLEDGQRLIFRFPREAHFPSELELSILRELRGKVPVAIPEPEFIGVRKRYMGYRRLGGVHLDDERYAAFDASKRERLGEDIARFFCSMHGALHPRRLAPLELRRATFGARLAEELPVLAGLPMAGLVEFARAAALDYAEVERRLDGGVVLFNDLHHENMLLDAQDRLSGVIDFGDVAYGDPHWEFRYFFWFNPDLLARAVAAYARLTGVALRLGRIRLYAVVQNLCEVGHSYRVPGSKVPRARAEAHLTSWIAHGPALWRDEL